MSYDNLSDLEYVLIRFIASFAIFLNSFILFMKSQQIRTTKGRIVFVFVINALISVVYALLNHNIELVQTISFLGIASSFAAILVRDNRTKALMIGLICISFAHIIKFLSTMITATVMWILQSSIDSLIPDLCINVISIILTTLFIRIKRFRNGIQFFEKDENLSLGMVISGVEYLISTIRYNSNQSSIPLLSIIIMASAISGFGLYLWIRKGITKHYREKLQLKSELYYKEQLEQKEQEIEKLHQSNAFLAKIVHRDNHLMNSLDSSITSYFESGDREFTDKLLREVQTLGRERAELINTAHREAKILPSTGNILIDGAVHDLYVKAAAHGIDFSLSVSETVDKVIGKYISQTDLQTLICDHIKDAVIAVDAKNEVNGKILVNLAMENDNYTVTVFDSGVDFETDTLAKLGKERVTTHADNGGSGIGFMTTFETLRKSYATLIITEFERKVPFSKSVSVCFDGNSSFIIQSYRKDLLKETLNRNDVILL